MELEKITAGMKKTTSLLIVREGPTDSPHTEQQEVILFEDFRNWVKRISLLSHVFSYEYAALQVHQSEYLPHPLLNFLLLRFLSRKVPFILDAEGKKQHVTIQALGHSITQFVLDWLGKPSLIRQITDCLSDDWIKSPTVHKIPLSRSQNPLVYLRTDLWFGVLAGGSVGHIAGVLNQFKQYTDNVIFLTTDRVPTMRDDIPTHLLRPINRYWDFQELPSLASNACFERQAIDAIGGLTPSFIYQRYSLNNFTGVSLARKYRIPLVLEYNGSEPWMARHWGNPLKYEKLSEKIELLNLRLSDVVVGVSQAIKDELIVRGIEADKILVNPNGVDPHHYSPDIDGRRIREQYGLKNKLVIGFMGTFGRWHGADVLARAFGFLLKEGDDHRGRIALLMIGDGLRMAEVKKTLLEFGVTEQATLTGLVPQNQGAEYLAACDILVSPHIPNADGTPFFGSPTKVFEYMAMGKAILASRLDQIGDVLEHGRTAWLVKPGDVEDLKNGLKLLIENPILRRRLGEAARKEVIAKYTWKEHTRRILEKLNERCG